MRQPPLATTIAVLKQAVQRLAGVLSVREEFYSLDLSIPETGTVAIQSDVGLRHRPPAVVRCPECTTAIQHRRPIDPIDCPACRTMLPPKEFTELELLALTCPRCASTMDHGVRHPDAVDGPQWATCPDCQYHWEYSHGT